MSVRVFALLTVVLSSVVARAAAPQPNAHVIADRIRIAGAKVTVNGLDDKGQLDGVLSRIGQGSAAWIALVPKLALGTDGASSEGLGIELARALPRNPVAVLQATDPSNDSIIGIKKVCGWPFIEATAASNAAYKRRAVTEVSKVHKPSLIAKRDQCLARLRS